MKKIAVVVLLGILIFFILPRFLLSRGPAYVPGKPMAGKATWYTDTILSSGKRFIDGDYAAMRSVPLGARVLVTTIDTGKSLVVEVNDRGPSDEMLKKNRIIDLTKSAFKKLAGDLELGEINVLVEVLPL